MRFPVTGAAGFIGSAVRPPFVGEFGATVHNVDKLTGTANIAS
jgi:nucleoside-diphosphate-sugar epimerase